MTNQGQNLFGLTIWGGMLTNFDYNWEDFNDYRDYLRNANEFFDGGK